MQCLTEIAGLLVLMRVASFVLGLFHEFRYNSKMKKETQEEFRDVFTYENFKQQIEINEKQNEMIASMVERMGEMHNQISEMQNQIDEIANNKEQNL